jgi:hypothetical protein
MRSHSASDGITPNQMGITPTAARWKVALAQSIARLAFIFHARVMSGKATLSPA